MTSIYDLSWNETSFRSKLRLFSQSRRQEREKTRSNNRSVQASGYSALSSTYYSIVGTAFSQLKASLQPKWHSPAKVAIWCLTWLPLAVWCYWRMLPLSDRGHKLGGYDDITADQYDIRQSILRRRGKYDEAKACIHAALIKRPEKAHTRGLLHVGLADVYRHKGDWRNAEREVRVALVEAEEAEGQDPRQAARIYRHCAEIIDFINKGDLAPGNLLRHKAQELAQAAGADDQLLKL